MSMAWILGEFRFDPTSGELRPLEGEGGAHLPPQPAQLLMLLLENGGEVLGRDAIREALWPDVNVGFDQSLNFCVHQLRTALGDSAGSPSYVETLPRRGYRLLVPAHPEEVTIPEKPSTSRSFPWAPAAALLLLGALAWLGVLRSGSPATANAAPRLAIMPFVPPAGVEVEGRPWEVAEGVLLALGNLGPDTVAIVGPATTTAYSSDLRELPKLLADVELDYILNGRFIESEGRAEPGPPKWDLLIELIRTSDGAHLWVRRYGDLKKIEPILREVLDGVRGELELTEG